LPNCPRELLKIGRQRMQLDRDAIKAAIRSKIIALAKALNIDATALGDADIIPAKGYLDSSAILELVVWYEQTYDFPLRQGEINIDNLGSIDAMTNFLLSRKRG
jgi:D-alanine--poly(phosphoribitol) ligase subunit 2